MIMKPTSPPAAFNRSELRYSTYDDTRHRAHILKICEHTFDGLDYIDKTLSGYPKDTTCTPVVIIYGDRAVAFCNRRVLRTDDETCQVCLIEALRVDEAMKGTGLGTLLMKYVMNGALAEVGPGTRVRFVANTEPHIPAMQRVFLKTGWSSLHTIIVWPSTDVSESVKDTDLPLLEALQIKDQVCSKTNELDSKWRQIVNENEIRETMMELRKYGASGLKIDYHVVNTLADACWYLKGEIADREGRSVWKLERCGRAVGLIFLRPRVLEESSSLPDESVAGCVVDVEAAESCVRFVSGRKEMRQFRITFDCGITDDMVRKSEVLSLVEHEKFIVYESVQDGIAEIC